MDYDLGVVAAVPPGLVRGCTIGRVSTTNNGSPQFPYMTLTPVRNYASQGSEPGSQERYFLQFITAKSRNKATVPTLSVSV